MFEQYHIAFSNQTYSLLSQTILIAISGFALVHNIGFLDAPRIVQANVACHQGKLPIMRKVY